MQRIAPGGHSSMALRCGLPGAPSTAGSERSSRMGTKRTV